MQHRINPKRLAKPVIRYRCPDCGEQAETPAGRSDSADSETYERCSAPAVDSFIAYGEVIAEDELGDPW